METTTAAAVESASAMEPAGCNAAMETTAYRASSSPTAGKTSVRGSNRSAASIAATSVITSTPVVTTVAVVTAMAPISATIPVEPGSCPDEYSAREPTRAVVTVRRAAIRRITVIPIRANRCSISAIHGPNSDTNSNPNLGLRRRG